MKSIILELDSYYPELIEEWLGENTNHQHYYIYILTKLRKHNILKTKLSSYKHIKCITYEDIFKYDSSNKLNPDTYFKFVNTYTNNHITSRLFDRSKYFPEYGIGNQNAFFHYSKTAYNVLLFLKDKNIDFICFRNTPHISTEWLLSKAIEFLDIQFYCFDDYIFPWLFTVRKGYSRAIELSCKDFNLISKPELKSHIKNCVITTSKTYNEAIPSAEKGRLGKGIFKYYNPFSKVKYFLFRPHRFVMKTKNYFYYKKYAKEVNLKNTKYIAFFLHYQPEKTTLPDGFEFADQFYAIKILSLMLPEGVKLLVKEHPSMFTDVSDPKYRTLYNYKFLKDLENVEILSMHTDAFEIIDNSLALASIKGTAALEAYIRKKPVITFGDNHLNLDGVHLFKNIENLQQFIDDVLNNKIHIENVVDNLTDICYGVSVSGLQDKPENVKDYGFNRDVRERASYFLLSKLLEQNLDLC